VDTSLVQGLSDATGQNGFKVRPTFQLENCDNIFVAGDAADLPEIKQGAKVGQHAKIVTNNILALIDGKAPASLYKKPTEAIFIPIGPVSFCSLWFSRCVL
jgi:NADH dehydrogenase FAD-containing subunit